MVLHVEYHFVTLHILGAVFTLTVNIQRYFRAMLAPEKPEANTTEANGADILIKQDDDNVEKVEKLKKIQDAASKATRNRKISLDMNRKPARTASHEWTISLTKLRAKREFENGIFGYDRGGSERANTGFDKRIQNKPEMAGLKLPSIRINNRRRSSTLGCVDDLKFKNERQKKLSFDSGVRDMRSYSEMPSGNELDDYSTPLNRTIDHDTGEATEQQGPPNTVGNDDLLDVGGENGDAKGVYRLCGHTSHAKNLSPNFYPAKQQANTGESFESERTIEVPKQVPISSHFASKVDDFLKRDQPGPSPNSLKISKTLFDERIKSKRPNIGATSKSKYSSCDSMFLTTSLCMNPFARPDDKPWYYATKEGRCRYLRAPMTPVLTVEEIFQHSDSKSSE